MKKKRICQLALSPCRLRPIVNITLKILPLRLMIGKSIYMCTIQSLIAKVLNFLKILLKKMSICITQAI